MVFSIDLDVSIYIVELPLSSLTSAFAVALFTTDSLCKNDKFAFLDDYQQNIDSLHITGKRENHSRILFIKIILRDIYIFS